MATPTANMELSRLLHNLNIKVQSEDNQDARKSSGEVSGGDATDREQATVEDVSEEDPYVLVLVDAHSHLFIDDILQKSTSSVGRREIRERLHTTVKQHLARNILGFPKLYRIVVRVYGDIKNLNGSFPNSLHAFAVGFSSADVLFDFTNVLDEGVVEEKITETFTTSLKDRNCKHIFLAAWRRPTYISMLRKLDDGVTIVEGYGMGAGFQFLRLSLPIIAFPEIFQNASRLELAVPTSLSICGDDVWVPNMARLMHHKKVCTQRRCRCELPHIQVSPEDVTRRVAYKADKFKLRLPGHLPTKTAEPGHVPLNKHGERLDLYMQHPESAYYLEYKARFPRNARQPCQWHHLLDNCRDGTACLRDHEEVSPKALHFMRFKAKLIPCADGTQCRRFDCCFGHVCQNKKCLDREIRACRMKAFHHVDPVVAQWVRGVTTQGMAN